ncbi:terpene cyclase/mutase family protein [Candidatus Dojkabacteria bacterium]|nr:terpene cyclase/mutase family protein [Candidatus Dojkabacteria bacterium]
MMHTFLKTFKYDLIKPLLSSQNESLIYFAKKDLLDQKVGAVDSLWQSKDALKIISKQKANGSWEYRGKVKDARDRNGYDQLETFRQIGFLIEKFGFNKDNQSIQNAAEYLFSNQTKDGDFRGIYGTQYATTYSPMISELLIKAGYIDDKRVIQSLDWLLKMRQDDGAWAIPLRTVDAKYMDVVHSPIVIEPDRTKPFSHLITGCVLRGLSVHPKYNKRPEVKKAGELLLSRFFKRDKYIDRSAISYWTGFSFPYWFTDLLASLDSLSRIGFSREEPQIQTAMQWFIDKQNSDGTWKTLKLLRGKDKQQHLWITLQIGRVFKRFFD